MFAIATQTQSISKHQHYCQTFATHDGASWWISLQIHRRIRKKKHNNETNEKMFQRRHITIETGKIRWEIRKGNEIKMLKNSGKWKEQRRDIAPNTLHPKEIQVCILCWQIIMNCSWVAERWWWFQAKYTTYRKQPRKKMSFSTNVFQIYFGHDFYLPFWIYWRCNSSSFARFVVVCMCLDQIEW